MQNCRHDSMCYSKVTGCYFYGALLSCTPGNNKRILNVAGCLGVCEIAKSVVVCGADGIMRENYSLAMPGNSDNRITWL